MKKILIGLVFLIIPVFASADRACPDYCANGNFYSRGSLDRSGVCIYPGKQECRYGCDGREKCLEGKDCPSKCEDGIYYYDGSFNVRAKDCKYEEKKCEYNCTDRGCSEAPAVRECNDYCKDGTYYSSGKYNIALRKCDYENKKKCVCDSEGEKCIDGDCSNRCLNGVSYFNGKPTADGKCKYETEEKCENGCDEQGEGCIKCQNRCFNGSYYYNGSYQNAGAGKKVCVFDEKICDAGCDDNDGCEKCKTDSDCAGKNVCKNGTIFSGWCGTGSPQELTVASGSPLSESGCYYNLFGACPTGVCNPIYKDMCGITIGPAVYEDYMDGKVKPMPGVMVTAAWKTSSGSESLPQRLTDETGHVYFSDEELYKYFSDKNASLEITASRENLPNIFNMAGSENLINRVIKVDEEGTYKVNLIFGSMSEKNGLDLLFSPNYESKKDKSYDMALKSTDNASVGTRAIEWFKGIKDSINDTLGKVIGF